MKISVIGLRAFPSEFIGTSGLEFYTEKIINKILQKNPNINFTIYTRSIYQNKINSKIGKNISIKPLLTLPSKTLETFIYSLIASIECCLDESKVVWFHGIGSCFFAFLPKLFGKKLIITLHSLDWERKKWTVLEKNIFKFLSFRALKYQATFFTVSRYLQYFMRTKFGVKSIYAPPGIEISKKKYSKRVLHSYGLANERYIIYLGRIVPEKRIELLIQSFIQIKKNRRQLKLVIVGGHGNFPEYEERLKAKYFDQDIIWTGYVFAEDKLSLLNKSCGFVLISELEGNPLSLYEALSLNKICLITQEIARELPKLGNVLILKKINKISLSKKIQQLGRLANIKRKYNKNEIKELKKFSWENSALNYENLF